MARKKPIKVLRKQKKKENVQRFTQIQNLGGNKLTAKEFKILKRMTHSAKALRNVGLYTIKKYFRENNRNATVKEIDDTMAVDVNYWLFALNGESLEQSLIVNRCIILTKYKFLK